MPLKVAAGNQLLHGADFMAVHCCDMWRQERPDPRLLSMVAILFGLRGRRLSAPAGPHKILPMDAKSGRGFPQRDHKQRFELLKRQLERLHPRGLCLQNILHYSAVMYNGICSTMHPRKTWHVLLHEHC